MVVFVRSADAPDMQWLNQWAEKNMDYVAIGKRICFGHFVIKSTHDSKTANQKSDIAIA